jgi:D-alanyl-D-alanine carboxypeptidase (penicillin-binding protein 5/6)
MNHLLFYRANNGNRLLLVGSALISWSLLALTPEAPQIEAAAYVLMDYNSGKIIASSAPHKKLPPTSLAKMMTMYALNHDLEAKTVSIDSLVPISEKAYKTPGSRMYLEKSSEVSVLDLMKGIAIQSGNDASVAIAEYLAGDEATFVQLMNLYATEMGLKDTHFSNATGLPEADNYTSAHDMAVLSRALIHDYPQTYYLYSEKSFKYNNIQQSNRNRLLWESPLVDGIKTGRSDEAGYSLAASAVKDKMRLIAVVLGAPSDKARTFETMRLFSYGFRFYKTIAIPAEQQGLPAQKVAFSAPGFVPITIKEATYITIPADRTSDLSVKLKIFKGLQAPLSHSESIGTIEISLDDKELATIAVYPATDVATGTLWTNLKDNLSYLWDYCWGKS